jgi:hypothetical protein
VCIVEDQAARLVESAHCALCLRRLHHTTTHLHMFELCSVLCLAVQVNGRRWAAVAVVAGVLMAAAGDAARVAGAEEAAGAGTQAEVRHTAADCSLRLLCAMSLVGSVGGAQARAESCNSNSSWRCARCSANMLRKHATAS